MSIVDYFDPKNIEHIKAFKYMQDTGTWPKKFWKEMEAVGVEFLGAWHSSLAFKIADVYVEEKMERIRKIEELSKTVGG